jgi:hypothetical protein
LKSKGKKGLNDLSTKEAKQLVDKIKKAKGMVGNYNAGVKDEMAKVVSARSKLASRVGKLKALGAAGIAAGATSCLAAIPSNPHFLEAARAAEQGDSQAVDEAMYDLASDLAIGSGDSRVLPFLYGGYTWMR